MRREIIVPKHADVEKGFLAHLSDLRRCLLRVFIAVLLGFAGSVVLSKELMQLLTAHAGKLVVLRPAEALMNQLKVALINGIIVSFPIVLWQIGVFLWPALYRNERRAILFYLPFALLLFAAGVAFGFLVVVRTGYTFLLSLVPKTMTAAITLDNYLSFALSSTLACGIIFLLPVAVLLLVRLGILKAAFLWRQQKVVIIGLMVLVAVITPTVDAVSMLLVFMPLLFLFELSILLAAAAEHRRKKRMSLMDHEA